MSALADRIQGTVIRTLGLGRFFNEKQNTVFIECDSARLREVWEKRDYGYRPHITLYDGDSREFASRLFARLSRIPLQFSFAADGVSPLISYKGQKNFDLEMAFDEEFISKLLGKRVSIADVDHLPIEAHLSYIESLAKRLPEFAQPALSAQPSPCPPKYMNGHAVPVDI